MVLFVLGLMIVLEIGFVLFSVLKQKEKIRYLRNRLFFNIIQLLIYLGTILLPGIDFSFRFRFFFFLLVIRVLYSCFRYLFFRKKTNGLEKKSKLICGAIFSIFFFCISLIPAFVFTGYAGKPTTGLYSVASTQVILTDHSRIEAFENDNSCREVPVHFYYPSDFDSNQTYPIVLFSHGAFGYYQSNTSTYMELASNGYVVMSLDHPYHSFFTKDTSGKTITVNPQFIQDVFYINESEISEEEIYEISKAWFTLREADINFVLDTIINASKEQTLDSSWTVTDNNESEILTILGIMNYDKIGLMGHSLGGAAVVSTGRKRDDISCVIDLDGSMIGEETGIKDGVYQFEEEPYPIPILSIDNEEHHVEGQQYGALYVNNIVLSNAVDGHNTYFKGAGHMNFTDLPLFSPFLASKLGTGSIDANHCIDTMNQIVLSYMNTYLKDAGQFTLQESYE